MANKVLSIYVGNDAIRIAEMQNTGKAVILSNAAEVSTPANSVNDGYIVDVTSVAEAIRTSIFGRGFSSKDVVFTVTSKKIASKEVDLPYMKSEKQLMNVLQSNSGEYFPMSNTGDYAFAFSVLDNYTDDEGRKTRVSAVAAPYDLLRCYYELAEELKLNVKNIDYFGNSIIQLLSVQMMPGRTDLVLQIEMDQTYVNVMRGKVLVMQRSVPYGKNAVINALMDVKKISEKDAKTLLSNETLIEQHVTQEEYAEAVSGLVSGIGRAVEYHRTKNPNDLLQGIKVFGEGSAIAGIEAILKRELGADVEHFENLQGVTVKGQASLTAEEVLRYLPNIGAVIKPMNLKISTGSASVGPDSVAIIKFLRIAFIIACLAMIGWVGYTVYENIQIKKQREELNQMIADIQDIEDIANAYDEANRQYTLMKDFERSTHNDNEYLLSFIEDLEVLMPTGTYVNAFTASNGNISFDVTTGWRTTTKNEVADVLVNVGTLPYVDNFLIPDITEEYKVLLGIDADGDGALDVDAEGNVIYLVEEDENGKEVEVIYDEDAAAEGLYDGLVPFTLVQTTYSVSCHICNPNAVQYDAANDIYFVIDENGNHLITDIDGNPIEEVTEETSEEGGEE